VVRSARLYLVDYRQHLRSECISSLRRAAFTLAQASAKRGLPNCWPRALAAANAALVRALIRSRSSSATGQNVDRRLFGIGVIDRHELGATLHETREEVICQSRRAIRFLLVQGRRRAQSLAGKGPSEVWMAPGPWVRARREDFGRWRTV
jgi:hypothetical protein